GTFSTGVPLVPPIGNSVGHPVALVVDPLNRFVFVGNSDAGSVTSYRIGPTGALTLIGLFATSTFFGSLEERVPADALAVDPAGKFLFVAGGTPQQPPDDLPLQVFRIEPSGVLTSIGMDRNSLSNSIFVPVLAVDPFSRFLFVAHEVESNTGLSVYD